MWGLKSTVQNKTLLYLYVVGICGTCEVSVYFLLILPLVQVFKLHPDIVGRVFISVITCCKTYKACQIMTANT